MTETVEPSRTLNIRARIKVLMEILQVVGIVVSAVWAAFTYADNSRTQKEATIRELRRPYEQKQLDLYLEASRVVARLTSVTDDPDRAKTEAIFWELYWGELNFVESTTFDEKSPAMQYSMERLMENFCHEVFTNEQCGIKNGDAKRRAAVDLVRTTTREIKTRWGENANNWMVAPTPFLERGKRDESKELKELFKSN